MPRRDKMQEFSPRSQFKVRVPFKLNGKLLRRGEPFHPNRFAVSDRRVRQLWDSRRIVQVDEPEPQPAKPEPKPEPQPEPEPEPVVEAEGPDFSSMTKAELVEEAKEREIPYAAQKNKSELIELLSQ